MKKSKLEAKCVHLNNCEIRAQKASRDSIKMKQCEYLHSKIGKIFKGMISSVQEYGVFVEIPETGCDGLVRMSEIGGDTFTADTQNHRVVGFNTGEVIKLGDEVSIVVSKVDIERKTIELQLIRL